MDAQDWVFWLLKFGVFVFLFFIVPVLGAADKAVNLGGCKSLHRQLPDNGRLVYPLFSEVTD
jgi:hypothetical protein